MEKIVVTNNGPLSGNVKVDGAKNAALPIIAASLLGTEPIILENVPKLSDINVILKVLESLGSKVEYLDENVVRIDSSKLTGHVAPMELMNRMRASFLVMGPLLARRGETMTYLPGGCAIGKRPIDLHLKGFKALGAKVIEEVDRIEALAKEGLVGDTIYIDFPSVGATQNIMMAATMAKGETVIENAAKEPEIVDLANFLNKLGANIKGAGTSAIRVKGVTKLGGGQHAIIPDRIEASTYMVAAAITRGDITVENCIPSHVMPIIAKLKEVGCQVYVNEEKDVIRVIGGKKLIGTDIKTLPYPGFPTDAQAQFMALLTTAEGQSMVTETVFENRFMHVDELLKMGAIIATDAREARIAGVPSLKGAQVRATDLRAGAALILAGLVAEGKTYISEVEHIDRGYDDIVGKFKKLGAKIERIQE
ncbi:UDP-N-acetylglucosamine 1-carboxyvinyltransferase [Lagierella sp.]|uniref:UDP-N-acetylglucosamine 1-carboxyvinyltransferase n=1 Tax=Lagierella sp. TaxID=2849657 RepID=UPI0026270337|nr:UDP-N-acetylglucosamine 1-carboxyvinyltransferase [Lagierella sp.]